MAGLNVNVLGLRETLRAIDSLDSRTRMMVRGELRSIAWKVAVDGQGNVNTQGLSGWKRWKGGYDPSVIRSGIRVTTVTQQRRGTYERSYVAVVNSTAAGAIWEVAGRRSKGRLPRRRTRTGRIVGKPGNGRAFVSAITSRDGKASRTVWRAFDYADRTYIRENFARTVDRESRITQSRINRAR